MSDLTAEQIQHGRGLDRTALAARRRLAHEMRSVRERIASTSGLGHAFDVELLRQFAQAQISAVPLEMVLLGSITAIAIYWVEPTTVLRWVITVLVGLAVMVATGRRLLGTSLETAQKVKNWRWCLVLAQTLLGACWSLIVGDLLSIDFGLARLFLLFVVIMVSAVTAMLAETVPLAVVFGLVPISIRLTTLAVTQESLSDIMLAAMAVGAQLFFLLFSNRLHQTTLTSLKLRAEKEALLLEVQEAKANSDEARRRAEEANLAKSHFLATMSHELRTPLNAILGFSEVMKGEVFGPHANPAYREYANDIHASGHHLLTLINEILDLSRIEAGRYDLREEAISIAHIIDDARHMLSLRAKAKNQTVHAKIEMNLPRLWADERATRQIVLNVLSNAIKFTPPGGEIWIKAGWTAGSGQYISIKDSGPGIPEEEIPLVLSSFGRGSLAIKTAEQGSGLGLPIVKGLVDLHGGTFILKAKPREGTEVVVTFPPERVMEALPPIESATASSAPPKQGKAA
ncbi:MAG: HAMP domain-containing histidine kinase [Hyphomicrobiales bacterium]|nr:HAMP domain-containing histidine kinase [Hyphomicrobiales bacterium]MBW0004639.1 HAMP domain-containing histidine kinase [Hyphomicrobiales bacterium]